jgi:zinc/manganese transport system substrate-binding protein
MRGTKSLRLRIFTVSLFTFAIVAFLFAVGTGSANAGVKVVAAENTYGDIVQQIGGIHVHVLSIMSDPNVDPHEYESNVDDARQIADADLVVENGGGYDDWMDKLMATTRNSKRTVINTFDIAPNHLKENEHVWYNPDNVIVFSQKILDVLKQKDPADSAEFEANFADLKADILKLDTRLGDLKAKFAKTPIALTETIFLYQSELIGLDVLTPWTFDKAIAEGNDPTPADAITAENQLTSRQAKILVYNVQTVTSITTKLQNEAHILNIPVVPVSETMPPGEHYQSWMSKQLDVLEAALTQTQKKNS